MTTVSTEATRKDQRPVLLGLSRNVVLLGVVSLFADISSEMVYPIIPLFLTGTLGAPVLAVGIIEGIAESTASILKFVMGWLSDRFRRRLPFTVAGYGLAAIAKPGLALAFAWPVVLFVRFVDRAGKGIRTAPRDALIASSTADTVRGRAFGFHRTLDTSGAIIGPLVALVLLALLSDSYRAIFLIALIPGALSVLALLAVKEVVNAAPREHLPPLLTLRGYDRRFLLFIGVMVLFSIGNSSDAFLILRARDLGLSATAVVLAYVVYNVTYAGLSLPAGIRSDRVGRRPVLIAGFAIFAAVYLGAALATDGWMVWPLFAVYGAYIAFTEGVGKAYVADLVPEQRRGSALGLYNASTGAMLLFASIMGGALWELFGPTATFLLGAASAGAAALLLALPAAWTDRADEIA